MIDSTQVHAEINARGLLARVLCLLFVTCAFDRQARSLRSKTTGSAAGSVSRFFRWSGSLSNCRNLAQWANFPWGYRNRSMEIQRSETILSCWQFDFVFVSIIPATACRKLPKCLPSKTTRNDFPFVETKLKLFALQQKFGAGNKQRPLLRRESERRWRQIWVRMEVSHANYVRSFSMRSQHRDETVSTFQFTGRNTQASLGPMTKERRSACTWFAWIKVEQLALS